MFNMKSPSRSIQKRHGKKGDSTFHVTNAACNDAAIYDPIGIWRKMYSEEYRLVSRQSISNFQKSKRGRGKKNIKNYYRKILTDYIKLDNTVQYDKRRI